ncbi:MAG: ABC transporter permease subunit [Solirubrobacteraceae bacterium]
MSAVTAPTGPASPSRFQAAHVTLPHVLRSEWTKLWSLRSTRWTLLVSVIAMAGLGPLVAAVQMSRWNQLGPHERATYDSINTAVGGWHLAQLAIGVLGVLVITGEYSTGMIRSSLMAVPRRLPVLWAKVLVFAAVTFALMLVSGLISFFAVQALVTQHHVQHGIGSSGALRTVVGTALYQTVLGLMCIGLGTILRNTAGAIAAFVALLFVLPGISAILPASVNNSISPYLPLNAGTTVASHHFDNPNHLSIWGGFALFCGYAVAAIVLGAITMMRRDA